jgi:hypothetical protein
MALAYYDLFRLTGDAKDETRCLDCIQQAVDLDPSDPILLFNSAAIVMEASTMDLVSKEIDLKALRRGGDLGLLRYLYKDEASRKAVMERVASHPGMIKALAYLDKSMLVSPKSVRAYASAYAIHLYARNEEALRTLAERIKGAGIDSADQLRTMRDYVAGKDDAKHAVAANSAVKRCMEKSNALRARGGVTSAVALVEYADSLIDKDIFSNDSDAGQAVSLATEAYGMAPCAATRNQLIEAHFFKVIKDCRRGNPAFEEYCRSNLRGMGNYGLVVAVASQEGPFWKEVTGHADFKAALDLIEEGFVLFPEGCTGREWAVLSKARPAAAGKFAEAIKRTPRTLLGQEVGVMLSPASPAEAAELYWTQRAIGNEAAARKALEGVKAEGLPMPVGM